MHVERTVAASLQLFVVNCMVNNNTTYWNLLWLHRNSVCCRLEQNVNNIIAPAALVQKLANHRAREVCITIGNTCLRKITCRKLCSLQNIFSRRSKQNAPVSIGVYFVKRNQMVSINNLYVLCCWCWQPAFLNYPPIRPLNRTPHN